MKKKQASNEKAILVGLAYTVGFVTAFIAFALTGAYQSHSGYTMTKKYHKENGQSTFLEERKVSILNKEDGLYVIKNKKERVISAKNTEINGRDGFHNKIMAASVSASGAYVHYCAQVFLNEDECVNYVYSVEQDMVFNLKDDGMLVTTPEAGSFATWIGQDTLSIEGRVAGHETNWELR